VRVSVLGDPSPPRVALLYHRLQVARADRPSVEGDEDMLGNLRSPSPVAPATSAGVPTLLASYNREGGRRPSQVPAHPRRIGQEVGHRPGVDLVGKLWIRALCESMLSALPLVDTGSVETQLGSGATGVQKLGSEDIGGFPSSSHLAPYAGMTPASARQSRASSLRADTVGRQPIPEVGVCRSR